MEAIFIILLMTILNLLLVILSEIKKQKNKFLYFCLGVNFAFLLVSIMMYISQNKN